MIRTALEELRTALGATQIQIIPQVVPAYQTNNSEDPSLTQKEPAHNQHGNGVNK